MKIKTDAETGKTWCVFSESDRKQLSAAKTVLIKFAIAAREHSAGSNAANLAAELGVVIASNKEGGSFRQWENAQETTSDEKIDKLITLKGGDDDKPF